MSEIDLQRQYKGTHISNLTKRFEGMTGSQGHRQHLMAPQAPTFRDTAVQTDTPVLDSLNGCCCRCHVHRTTIHASSQTENLTNFIKSEPVVQANSQFESESSLHFSRKDLQNEQTLDVPPRQSSSPSKEEQTTTLKVPEPDGHSDSHSETHTSGSDSDIEPDSDRPLIRKGSVEKDLKNFVRSNRLSMDVMMSEKTFQNFYKKMESEIISRMTLPFDTIIERLTGALLNESQKIQHTVSQCKIGPTHVHGDMHLQIGDHNEMVIGKIEERDSEQEEAEDVIIERGCGGKPMENEETTTPAVKTSESDESIIITSGHTLHETRDKSSTNQSNNSEVPHHLGNQQSYEKSERHRNLINAIRNDDIFTMTELLKTEDGMDMIDGLNLLHLVAVHNRYKLVAPLYAVCDYEALYVMRVGSQSRLYSGMTAVEIADKFQHKATSNMIEVHNIFTQSLSRLHLAARKGDLQSMSALCANTRKVDVPGVYGNTPVYTACVSGKLEAVKMLIQHGADVTKLNDWGDTLLHRAARWGQYDVVEFLLRTTLRRDINRKNHNGWTALHMAVFYGSASVVRLLLQNRAKADTTDVRRVSPLDTAIEERHREIAKILRGEGLKPRLPKRHRRK
ncbi:uncharacterized protein [Ptychodera flava]|uniref:uncharacterized protein n=1 Tax=Ptychodera flava TaxID=63121 RepID=UPI00396A5769